MCKTKLAVKCGEKEEVNDEEVVLVCEKADNIIEEVQPGIFGRAFA